MKSRLFSPVKLKIFEESYEPINKLYVKTSNQKKSTLRKLSNRFEDREKILDSFLDSEKSSENIGNLNKINNRKLVIFGLNKHNSDSNFIKNLNSKELTKKSCLNWDPNYKKFAKSGQIEMSNEKINLKIPFKMKNSVIRTNPNSSVICKNTIKSSPRYSHLELKVCHSEEFLKTSNENHNDLKKNASSSNYQNKGKPIDSCENHYQNFENFSRSHKQLIKKIKKNRESSHDKIGFFSNFQGKSYLHQDLKSSPNYSIFEKNLTLKNIVQSCEKEIKISNKSLQKHKKKLIKLAKQIGKVNKDIKLKKNLTSDTFVNKLIAEDFKNLVKFKNQKKLEGNIVN